MSNITSYPGIQLIENDDLMVISDVSEAGNPTRTISIGTLSTVFGEGVVTLLIFLVFILYWFLIVD